MNRERGYSIVGWGIAGATLAWQFNKAGVLCKVYDSGKNYSSRVAAGMINPIVFKRLTKGWKVDDLMPYAKEFYQLIEQRIQKPLLSHRSIVRVFSSVEEQNNWAMLEGDGRYAAFLNPVETMQNDFVIAQHGVGKVNSLGHLDINEFLNASKIYLSKNGIEFIEDSFSSEITQIEDHYIYCEGYQILNNHLFSYIPMKLTHGDILTIRSRQFGYEDILNKGIFILPLGKDLYRVGSTYNWDQLDTRATQKGKKELLDRLRSFCTFEFEVVDHKAGIRPTVADRRPLLGTHPNLSNVHVFNGLGTKGVSMAPYFSLQILDYLLEKKELDREVDIKRFEKHFNA